VNRALVRKCVLEARLLFAAMAALLFALCWVRVYIVSRLQMSQFAAIVEQVWDQFKAFSPVPFNYLISYTGRIGFAYNEPIVVFGVSLFAMARGSDAVSGELNRGTMEMLLAQPLSRFQVLFTQAVVTVSCLLLLGLATWGGTAAGIYTTHVMEDAPRPAITVPAFNVRIPLPLAGRGPVPVPMRERTDAAYFVPGAFNLFCLGVAVAGFSTLVSAFDRYRWRTIGAVVACYVVHLILKLVGQGVSDVAWLQYLSIFTAYEPQEFIRIAAHDPAHAWALIMPGLNGQMPELGPLGCNLILLVFGIVSYIAAGVVFRQRDLPAPL
jgi:ABC-2 type transport system permease protein